MGGQILSVSLRYPLHYPPSFEMPQRHGNHPSLGNLKDRVLTLKDKVPPTIPYYLPTTRKKIPPLRETNRSSERRVGRGEMTGVTTYCRQVFPATQSPDTTHLCILRPGYVSQTSTSDTLPTEVRIRAPRVVTEILLLILTIIVKHKLNRKSSPYKQKLIDQFFFG